MSVINMYVKFVEKKFYFINAVPDPNIGTYYIDIYTPHLLNYISMLLSCCDYNLKEECLKGITEQINLGLA